MITLNIANIMTDWLLFVGMVVTVSLPVFHQNTFVGVAGIDISLADLLEAATFLQEGGASQSYAFVIDKQRQTMVHPLIPQPQEVTEDPVFVHISNLEFNSDTEEVIASMVRLVLL